MKVTIKHRINNTLIEFYTFEIYGSSISYEGIMYSRRAHSKDLWGHEWDKYFDKQKKKEFKEVDNNYDNGKISSEWEYQSTISKVRDKYNPTCHYIKDGKRVNSYSEGVKSYYSGSFGPNSPKPKLSKEQIKEKIGKILAGKVKTAKMD